MWPSRLQLRKEAVLIMQSWVLDGCWTRLAKGNYESLMHSGQLVISSAFWSNHSHQVLSFYPDAGHKILKDTALPKQIDSF